MRTLLVLALLLAVALPARAAAPCGACQAAGGTYQAVAPPGWDGRSRLRLLVFLHGWMMEGADITDMPAFVPLRGGSASCWWRPTGCCGAGRMVVRQARRATTWHSCGVCWPT